VKKIILALMCMVSFNSFAYAFNTTIQLGKGEIKEFTVSGLYGQFTYNMRCKLTVNLADVPLHPGYISTAYILISHVNGVSNSIQKPFGCSRAVTSYGTILQCSNTELMFLVRNGDTFQFINKPDIPFIINCTTD